MTVTVKDGLLAVTGTVLPKLTTGETLIRAYVVWRFIDDVGTVFHETSNCALVVPPSALDCLWGAFDVSRVRRIVITASRIETEESEERKRPAEERRLRDDKARHDREERALRTPSPSDDLVVWDERFSKVIVWRSPYALRDGEGLLQAGQLDLAAKYASCVVANGTRVTYLPAGSYSTFRVVVIEGPSRGCEGHVKDALRFAAPKPRGKK